jgi:diguanylate cyclase
MDLVGSTMASLSSLEAATRPLLDEVTKTTGLETAFLTRIHEASATQEVLYVGGTDRDLVPEGVITDWDSTMCRLLFDRGMRMTLDAAADFPDADVVAQTGIRAYVSVPIVRADGTVYGTLCAGSRQPVADDASTPTLVDLFARLLADVVEREDARANSSVSV